MLAIHDCTLGISPVASYSGVKNSTTVLFGVPTQACATLHARLHLGIPQVACNPTDSALCVYRSTIASLCNTLTARRRCRAWVKARKPVWRQHRLAQRALRAACGADVGTLGGLGGGLQKQVQAVMHATWHIIQARSSHPFLCTHMHVCMHAPLLNP